MQIRNGHHTPTPRDHFAEGRRDFRRGWDYDEAGRTGQALWDYAAGWNAAAEAAR